jgi:hypothetical protein
MKAIKRTSAAESMPAFDADHTIKAVDPELWRAIERENQRQHDHIELIASENYVSPTVMQAQGSQLTNKYAEGYPGRRYYGGCEFVDIVEQLAIDRVKKLRFKCHRNAAKKKPSPRSAPCKPNIRACSAAVSRSFAAPTWAPKAFITARWWDRSTRPIRPRICARTSKRPAAAASSRKIDPRRTQRPLRTVGRKISSAQGVHCQPVVQT